MESSPLIVFPFRRLCTSLLPQGTRQPSPAAGSRWFTMGGSPRRQKKRQAGLLMMWWWWWWWQVLLFLILVFLYFFFLFFSSSASLFSGGLEGLFTHWRGHCRLMKWHLPFVCGGGRACQVVIKPDSANWLRAGTPFVWADMEIKSWQRRRMEYFHPFALWWLLIILQLEEASGRNSLIS